MKRRWIAVGLIMTTVVFGGYRLAAKTLAQGGTEVNPTAHELTVFRSPLCGCCGQWIEHMRVAGFTVKDTLVADLAAVKEDHGITSDLASCHTTLVNGYVVEGHVPAADVQRLLTEQPDVVGIAVPGMPIGSPGMEVGDQTEPYTVLAFTADGEPTVFAEHF